MVCRDKEKVRVRVGETSCVPFYLINPCVRFPLNEFKVLSISRAFTHTSKKTISQICMAQMHKADTFSTP